MQDVDDDFYNSRRSDLASFTLPVEDEEDEEDAKSDTELESTGLRRRSVNSGSDSDSDAEGCEDGLTQEQINSLVHAMVRQAGGKYTKTDGLWDVRKQSKQVRFVRTCNAVGMTTMVVLLALIAWPLYSGESSINVLVQDAKHTLEEADNVMQTSVQQQIQPMIADIYKLYFDALRPKAMESMDTAHNATLIVHDMVQTAQQNHVNQLMVDLIDSLNIMNDRLDALLNIQKHNSTG